MIAHAWHVHLSLIWLPRGFHNVPCRLSLCKDPPWAIRQPFSRVCRRSESGWTRSAVCKLTKTFSLTSWLD